MIYFFLAQALDCHTSLLETATEHFSNVYTTSRLHLLRSKGSEGTQLQAASITCTSSRPL